MPTMDFADIDKFSVSLWVCPLTTNTSSRVFSFGINENKYFNLISPYKLNDKLYYGSTMRNGNTNPTCISSQTFESGVWKHLVVTYDASQGGEVKLYEDGVQVSSARTGLELSFLGVANNNVLGRGDRLNVPDFYGYMDDFKAYDRVLSSDEISQMTADGYASLVKNYADSFSLAEYNRLTSLDKLMQNINVPGADEFAQLKLDNIIWRTRKSSAISADGTVKEVSEPVSTGLNATFIRGNIAYETNYYLTVAPKGDIVPDPVDITTNIGALPELPATVAANDGTAKTEVTWDMPETAEYAKLCAGENEFTINGVTAEGKNAAANIHVDSGTFVNQLINPPSPDPYITYHDGYYYYIKSSNGVNVSRARRLQDIGSAPMVRVWNATDGFSEPWAPELHYVDGCWYIYLAPVNKNDGNRRRMYVLRSTEPENPMAEYEMVGQIGPTIYNEETGEWELDKTVDENGKYTQNLTALDGTVLEAGGKKYFIYSAHVSASDTSQRLYINEMLDATTVKGSRVKLPAGGSRFEKMDNIGNSICEGPQILKHDGKVFVLYSTDRSNTCWYQLCVLYADENSDLLNPDNWTKIPGPLLTKSLDAGEMTYAPGHACTVQSPDGTEDWLIYHAYSTNGSDNMGAQEDRSARALKIEWDENGLPVFGNPVPHTVLQSEPSGTTQNVVALKYEGENAVFTGDARVVSDKGASGKKALDVVNNKTTVTFNVNVPEAGNYLVSLMATANSTKTCTTTLNINGTDYTLLHRMNKLNNGTLFRYIPSCVTESESGMVGEGLYVDLAAGENVITVTAASASDYVAIDYLYLLKEDEPSSCTVTLNKGTMELTVGESDTLTATVTPAAGETVVWKSSDETVATVDADGKVTAVSSGTAIITASLADGTSASCSVTVKDSQIVYSRGDIDKNGEINVSDMLALKNLIMSGSCTSEQLALGDMDGNGKLEVGDMLSLKNVIMSA